MDIGAIQERLRQFASDRDWEQFHSPKNLAMAVVVEAAELLEHFQWLSEAESYRLEASTRAYADVRDEVADVLIYLLRLADLLHIDIETAVTAKMEQNARKYPVELSKGNAVKYNRREELGGDPA